MCLMLSLQTMFFMFHSEQADETVCVCVYVCVCVCAYMYACVHACVWWCMYECVFLGVCICDLSVSETKLNDFRCQTTAMKTIPLPTPPSLATPFKCPNTNQMS